MRSVGRVTLCLLVGLAQGSTAAAAKKRPKNPPPPPASTEAPTGDLDLEPLPLVPPPSAAPTTEPEDPSLLPIVAPPAPTRAPATSGDAPAPTSAAVQPVEVSGPPSPWLTYAGIGVAGLGVVSLALGAYFGISSATLYDSVTYGPGGTSQIAGGDIDARVASGDRTANILFALGGGLIVLGAVALALDAFVVRPSVTVVDGGGAVGLGGTF